MSRPLLRHDIVGTEVGQPRPPAYMRRGRTRRTRYRRRRPGGWIILALALCLMAAVLAAGGLAAPWRPGQ